MWKHLLYKSSLHIFRQTHVSFTSSVTPGGCEWVMSHIWMNRVTNMNESCHTYTIESCTHEWSITSATEPPEKDESWHTQNWVMRHMWMSHVAQMNDAHTQMTVTGVIIVKYTHTHTRTHAHTHTYVYIYIYCLSQSWDRRLLFRLPCLLERK